MHPAIQTYFEADRRRDGDALVGAFGPEAAVTDEGRTHVGHAAIGAWWAGAKAKYEAALEPLAATQAGAETTVRARVSGNFPGSPAVLTFAFRTAGDRIETLEIGA